MQVVDKLHWYVKTGDMVRMHMLCLLELDTLVYVIKLEKALSKLHHHILRLDVILIL